ncbi:MAG: response regulator transcription factor [Bacteroidia bacterium]|nr:response regulator transcription factor [Bacteroidia bacterium]
MANKENKYKILLVEDDNNLGFVLKDYLEMIGYQVVLKKDGHEGVVTFKNDIFDLCILDVMMPLKDGFTVATEIRSINQSIPIIFLTALSMNEDKIKGFKIGADDYITKPFSTEELSLRVEAILRRTKNMDSIGLHYHIGKIIFDTDNYLLKQDETVTRLTRKESELLLLLCQNMNKLVKRETVLEKIWGRNDYFMGRSMDVYITRIRKYLKTDPTVEIINVHGTGFKLEAAAEEH